MIWLLDQRTQKTLSMSHTTSLKHNLARRTQTKSSKHRKEKQEKKETSDALFVSSLDELNPSLPDRPSK
jgi:hypothetical protein